MKTNKLYIILVLVFLTATSWAQVPTDSVRAVEQSVVPTQHRVVVPEPLGRFRNDLKVSLFPLVYSAFPNISYERALPHRSVVEVGLGSNLPEMQDDYAGIERDFYDYGRHVVTFSAGYKFMLSVSKFDPTTKPKGYYWVPPLLRGEIYDYEDYPFVEPQYRRVAQRKAMVEEGYLVSGWYAKAQLNYYRVWRTFDCFVRNEGSQLITENRTFHENDISLALVFGFQSVGQRGFVADYFLGFCIPLVQSGPFHNLGYYNYISWNVFTGGIRLGWAF